MMIVIENCAVATVDARRHRVRRRARRRRRRPDRRGRRRATPGGTTARCAGSTAPAAWSRPGLVNTHHHLYQWATRGLAQDGDLFELAHRAVPGLGPHRRRAVVGATAAAGLGWLALSGCTTVDRPPLRLPARRRRPVRRARSRRPRRDRAAVPPVPRLDGPRRSRTAGCRRTASSRTPTRRWPPPRTAIDRYHDPSPGLDAADRGRAVLAVLGHAEADDARPPRWPGGKGVRLHTHLAETVEEEEFCRETLGCTPVEYAERLGWLGDDVWLAHGVHLDDAAIARLGATGTGVAHCPSSNARLGAGIAPVRDLLDAGVPVGLGVDGAASQEAGQLGAELRQALLRGPAARRAGRADRPGGAGARHHRRRPVPRPRRRDRLAGGRQARRPRAVAARRARPRRHRRPGRGAGVRPAAAAGAAARRRRAGRASAASCAPPTTEQLARGLRRAHRALMQEGGR